MLNPSTRHYLSGAIAIIIAIFAVAFTAPKEKGPNATYTFHYGLGTFTQMQVQTNGNWTSGASSCVGAADKACQMEVTDTYTHLSGGVRVLNSSGSVIVIKAKLGGDGSDYIPDPPSSTGVPSATDKQ